MQTDALRSTLLRQKGHGIHARLKRAALAFAAVAFALLAFGGDREQAQAQPAGIVANMRRISG